MLACQANNYEHPMVDHSGSKSGRDVPASGDSSTINLVQRGNLKLLEATLHKQWRSGQNIVLCWSADERGVLVIWVPHYFLGNYCAQPDARQGDENEKFVGELISGSRRMSRDELFALAAKFDVAPGFVKLNSALSEDEPVQHAVEQIIKRYGLSFVRSRGVLLFDIAGFSLYTPFEQASQLNSLSYSMNSAYNKLLAQGIDVNFARTTTGDGYYVWNRDEGAYPDQDLFLFMLLVVADNAIARAASRGNTVPLIRSAYHAGSHYELYQAEGINPSVFSYIVGDVTIDLARMVDLAQPHQILVGDFNTAVRRHGADSQVEEEVDALAFVRHCNSELGVLRGVQLSGKSIVNISCKLSGDDGDPETVSARRFRVVDKHGLSRHTHNLQICIELEDQTLELGIGEQQLPGSGEQRSNLTRSAVERRRAGTARGTSDEPPSVLRKRSTRSLLPED